MFIDLQCWLGPWSPSFRRNVQFSLFQLVTLRVYFVVKENRVNQYNRRIPHTTQSASICTPVLSSRGGSPSHPPSNNQLCYGGLDTREAQNAPHTLMLEREHGPLPRMRNTLTRSLGPDTVDSYALQHIRD